MKIMLSSFGVTPTYKRPVGYKALFDRMPPIDMQSIGKTFMPDYAALLLCDKIIADKFSFDILTNEPPPAYSDFARTILLLYDEGFVELKDYSSILESNRAMFDAMMEHDTKYLEQWFAPFASSVRIWRTFVDSFYNQRGDISQNSLSNNLAHSDLNTQNILILHGELWELAKYAQHNIDYQRSRPYSSNNHPQAREPKNKRQVELRNAFNQGIRNYLSLVNSNLVISNDLGVGFYDWSDFTPFYKHKFLAVGRDLDFPEKVEATKKLFSVSLPELSVDDPKVLIRILKDKRLKDLRQLVDEAVEGKVVFDDNFARRTLFEVIESKEKSAFYRNLVSYLTFGLGFVPGVSGLAQKALEDVAGLLIDKKTGKNYRWFYMLNDINSRSKSKNRRLGE